MPGMEIGESRKTVTQSATPACERASASAHGTATIEATSVEAVASSTLVQSDCRKGSYSNTLPYQRKEKSCMGKERKGVGENEITDTSRIGSAMRKRKAQT